MDTAELENILQNNQITGPVLVALQTLNETIFGGEVVAILRHL
jgi:hypothetical protein